MRFVIALCPLTAISHRMHRIGSLSTSEVKWWRARLVLAWGTGWEALRVLSAFFDGVSGAAVATGLSSLFDTVARICLLAYLLESPGQQ